MEFIEQNPFIISFICAELFLCISRSQKITIVCKKRTQRTEKENSQVRNGLRRSLLLEVFLFVPASVLLFLLVIFPLIVHKLPQIKVELPWYVPYGMVGVAAYGFPFIAIRQIIKRIALVTLREFATITLDESTGDDSQEDESTGDDS